MLWRARRSIRAGQSLFGCRFGVRRGVTGFQGCAVMRYRHIAFFLNVKNPAKVDMAPGQRTGIMRGLYRLLEITACAFHVAGSCRSASKDEKGAPWVLIALRIAERLLRELLRTGD